MTAPILHRPPAPSSPPACGSCGQYLPWHPPLCTCGHPLHSHHETRGGTLTRCEVADADGPCDCPRYEHAVDGHYGPREVAPCT